MTRHATRNTRRLDIKRGHGSDQRPLAGALWASERYSPDAPAVTEHGNLDPENRSVDFARYIDPEYGRAELQHVWMKTWIYAAREEDIPAVGDRVPVDVGPLSWFVVRSGPDEFKAFYNACLHRGTRLCAKAESGESIRCPYHAWEWDMKGRLKKIPSHWDFTEVTRVNGSLPEVRLERWGGFIFINADSEAPPLEKALGIIPDHFKEFDPGSRYTAARFRKVVKANWKVAQEAFQEAYHLYATHPEAVPFAADAQTQYDVWESDYGHVGRNAGSSGIPSIHAPADATVFEATRIFIETMRDWHYPGAELPTLDPDGDLRDQMAVWLRAQILARYGRKSEVADAVLIDSLLYFFFPHACFWLSEAVPFTYRFTPHPHDVAQCYFEVRMLLPIPAEGPTPPSSPLIEIGADESVYKKAPAFGFLAYVFDQDMSNMPLVQLGMHAADPAYPRSRLGTYQESLIQHWNAVLDRMIPG